MRKDGTDHLVESVVTAPIGAALLEQLEHGWVHAGGQVPPTSAPSRRMAADAVRTEPMHELLETILRVAGEVGPWSPTATRTLARALASAAARRSVAEAVVDRLRGHDDQQRLGAGAQEWWWDDKEPTDQRRHAYRPLGSPRRPCSAWVTATWDGLWTVTPPTDQIAEQLVSDWEIWGSPVTRWQVRVADDAQVFQVESPDDWRHLVDRCPSTGRDRLTTSWELPGPNQDGEELDALLAVPGQHAVRTEMRAFVEPDWDAVARDWDGVHLTWLGFLTTEGTIIDLDGGDVAMLRNWASERTLWLNPVLDQAEPRPAPTALRARPGRDLHAVDPRDDRRRFHQDRAWLCHRRVGLRAEC